MFFIYIFLPLCFLLYFGGKNIRYRNFVLILFSLVFYAWGEPVWLLLLLTTSVVDYFNGRLIERLRGKSAAKLGIVISLVVNLGLLVTFKYSGFVVSNANSLFGTAIPVPDFALPLGISFYSFQSISYVIDVYRGDVKAQKNYFRYLMYISLFFQLVAGPIVRYKTIAEETECRHTTLNEFSDGLFRFIYGLGKKVILANTLGGLATKFLDFESKPSSVAAIWIGVVAFTLQIFFDFSGYSDMAIGLGRMCGFHFAENFNYPYIATSVSDFWRRWHISMGSFFRDYVYIPLGGNRKHVYLNLFVVWFLTGLWHGASWNFILWGLYFGVFIAVEKLFLGKILKKIPRFFSHIYLLFIVIIGWALFYYTDFSKLWIALKSMFGAGGIPLYDELSTNSLMQNIFVVAVSIALCMPIMKSLGSEIAKRETDSDGIMILSRTVKIIACLAILIVSSLLLVGKSYNPFLYYRF